MTCDYSINIDGKKYVLFSSDEDINSLAKLRKVLYKKISEDNIEALKSIKEALVNLDNIPEINLDDVTENSVGLHSPAELISVITNNRSDETLWRKLKISNWDSNIVVAGFGNESIKTQFHKGHIYLNLNYLDGFSNNIIALTELALFNVYKESYNSIDLSKLINSSSEEDLIKADEILESLIKNTDTESKNKLIRNIKTAYYKSEIIPEFGSRNINTERLNLEKVWNKYVFDLSIRDTKYYPKSTTRIEDLKQGDLVLIPNVDKLTDKKATDWNEIFYDYYVDIDNNFVIRTIGKNSTTGTYFLRNRPASSYQYTDDKEWTIKEHNKAVEARIYTEEVLSGYVYNDKDLYVEIATNFGMKHMQYTWVYNLLKKNGAKIVSKQKTGKGKDAKEISTDLKIKKIEGHIITLEDNSKVNIVNVKHIKIPSPNLDIEMTSENFDTNYRTPSVGERVIAVNDKTEVIGLVVGFNVDNNKIIYIYNTDKGPKSVTTDIKNIKAVEFPKDTNEFKLGDALPKMNIYLKNIFKNSKSVQEAIILNQKNYSINLENLPFNVEDIHEFSSIKIGSILYNPTIRQFHKVIDSKFDKFDSDKSYLKTVVEVGGKLKYINIPRENLNNYIMFTNYLNKTFAEFNIIKNSYELFEKPQDNGSYVEVRVYKNPNGFKFVLPTSEDVTKSSLYEKGTTDITESHKETLKKRYKWLSLPKSLYAKLDAGKYKKDTMNTIFLPFNNVALNNLLSSKQDLHKLVPGSFITFENNAKVFIVEKILNDKIQISKASYTKYESDNSDDLSYVRTERIIIDKNIKLNIAGIHIPKWAPNSYESLKKFAVVSDPLSGNKKSVYTTDYGDSKEFVIQLSSFLEDKFGVKINIIKNSDVAKFGDPELFKASAFVTKNEIYVNIDKASIAEPLHEMLHLVMATLKNNNPDNYYRIVNSVQYHPIFKQVAGSYLEINTELLEETFIKLFTLTFRNNILKAGVFNEEEFEIAIKNSITDMLNLEESLDWEDSFSLMRKPIRDILTEFGSSLLANEESLLDKSSVYTMFDIADTIRELLETGKLEQKCNY